MQFIVYVQKYRQTNAGAIQITVLKNQQIFFCPQLVQHMIELFQRNKNSSNFPVPPFNFVFARMCKEYHQFFFSIFRLSVNNIFNPPPPCGASTRFLVMASPYGASRSHSLCTTHSVCPLWTSDQPDAETSTWQHNSHKRQTSMPPSGFELAVTTGERSQTHALDRAGVGIGISKQHLPGFHR